MLSEKSRVYVAGTDTLIGNTLINTLKDQGYTSVFQDEEPDLNCRGQVEMFFKEISLSLFFLPLENLEVSRPILIIRQN